MGSNNLRWAFDVSRWLSHCPEWAKALRCIQNEERIRIRQFRFRQDALLSLAGRLMLRRAGMQILRCNSNKDIVFQRSEKGKPILKDCPPGWNINISHDGSLCVLAAEKSSSDHSFVGVDVMQVSRSDHLVTTPDESQPQCIIAFFNRMRRKFLESEWSQIIGKALRYSQESLHQSPFPEQIIFSEIEQKTMLRRFLRFWCLKESFVKAKGSGLAWDLQRISFEVPRNSVLPESFENQTKVFIDNARADGWKFEEYLVNNNDYIVSVALFPRFEDCHRVKQSEKPIFHFFDSFDDLMKDLDPLEESDLSDEHEWLIFNQMEAMKPSSL